MSKIYDWKTNINLTELNNVKEALNNGELVIFPTETVYGIGADAFNAQACKKIFEAKGRPSDNPLIVHVSDREMLDKCVSDVSEIENKLIKAFMPGPFTLILHRSDVVPLEVTAGLETVAIRMPDNKIANKIISEFGKPIAAPSANRSGLPSGTRISDIEDELGDKVFALVDGGETKIGLESTVVRVIDGCPVILRPGAVTAEDIQSLIGSVSIDKHVLNNVENDEVVLSPGMKHKHYAPKTKCVMIKMENKNDKEEFIKKATQKNICILKMGDNNLSIPKEKYFNMGNNLDEVSKNIFALLREVDKLNFDLILIDAVKEDGIGLAIMNRLLRTCGYNVLNDKNQAMLCIDKLR